MRKSILLIRLLAMAGIVAVALTAVSYLHFSGATRQSLASSSPSVATTCGYVTAVTYSPDASDADKIAAVTVNTTSMGFKGPTALPRELLTELLQLKLVEKIATPSDGTQSVFHLTDAGREHAKRV